MYRSINKPKTTPNPQLHLQISFPGIVRKLELLQKISRFVVTDVVGRHLVFTD